MEIKTNAWLVFIFLAVAECCFFYPCVPYSYISNRPNRPKYRPTTQTISIPQNHQVSMMFIQGYGGYPSHILVFNQKGTAETNSSKNPTSTSNQQGQQTQNQPQQPPSNPPKPTPPNLQIPASSNIQPQSTQNQPSSPVAQNPSTSPVVQNPPQNQPPPPPNQPPPQTPTSQNQPNTAASQATPSSRNLTFIEKWLMPVTRQNEMQLCRGDNGYLSPQDHSYCKEVCEEEYDVKIDQIGLSDVATILQGGSCKEPNVCFCNIRVGKDFTGFEVLNS